MHHPCLRLHRLSIRSTTIGCFYPCHVLTITPQNPALLAFAQSKLDGLVGKPSGYIESLPLAVRRRIDGLKGVQAKHSEIEGEFQLAILELEKKVCGPRCLFRERMLTRSAVCSSLSSTNPFTNVERPLSRVRLSLLNPRLRPARLLTWKTLMLRKRRRRRPRRRLLAARMSRVSPSSG